MVFCPDRPGEGESQKYVARVMGVTGVRKSCTFNGAVADRTGVLIVDCMCVVLRRVWCAVDVFFQGHWPESLRRG